MKRITIAFPADGSAPTMKVDGVKGKSCHDLTKALREALGETTSIRDTSAAYEVEVERVTVGAK